MIFLVCAHSDDATFRELERFVLVWARTCRIINLGDDRIETQPPPQHVDKMFNDTHLVMKHTQWLVDGNKWCDNKVETRNVHCALKPLHGSQ